MSATCYTILAFALCDVP